MAVRPMKVWNAATSTWDDVAVSQRGDVVNATDFAAKGDIITGTGAGTYDNLAAGSNGQVLKANSATATGLEWAAAGKILQVVRATDSTLRSTNSTSLVDANISVTITPTSASSAILLIWSAAEVSYGTASSGGYESGFFAITDNSNNPISGAESTPYGADSSNTQLGFIVIGYATPNTTSATTYKGRFRIQASGMTTELLNSVRTGQLFAIEVGA